MASTSQAKKHRKAAHSVGQCVGGSARNESLTPDEQDLYERSAKLTGVGFSALVRRQLTPKIRAAVGMLEDARRVFYGDSGPGVEAGG